jgi:hypothetical protein
MPALQFPLFVGNVTFLMKGEATDSAYKTLAVAEPAFTL